jgi:hypothetical protein
MRRACAAEGPFGPDGVNKINRVDFPRTRGGLPHSEIAGSKPIRGSPALIAAYHVLHRLCVPRHSPDALNLLDHSHRPCPLFVRSRSAIQRNRHLRGARIVNDPTAGRPCLDVLRRRGTRSRTEERGTWRMRHSSIPQTPEQACNPFKRPAAVSFCRQSLSGPERSMMPAKDQLLETEPSHRRSGTVDHQPKRSGRMRTDDTNARRRRAVNPMRVRIARAVRSVSRPRR